VKDVYEKITKERERSYRQKPNRERTKILDLYREMKEGQRIPPKNHSLRKNGKYEDSYSLGTNETAEDSDEKFNRLVKEKLLIDEIRSAIKNKPVLKDHKPKAIYDFYQGWRAYRRNLELRGIEVRKGTLHTCIRPEVIGKLESIYRFSTEKELILENKLKELTENYRDSMKHKAIEDLIKIKFDQSEDLGKAVALYINDLNDLVDKLEIQEGEEEALTEKILDRLPKYFFKHGREYQRKKHRIYTFNKLIEWLNKIPASGEAFELRPLFNSPRIRKERSEKGRTRFQRNTKERANSTVEEESPGEKPELSGQEKARNPARNNTRERVANKETPRRKNKEWKGNSYNKDKKMHTTNKVEELEEGHTSDSAPEEEAGNPEWISDATTEEGSANSSIYSTHTLHQVRSIKEMNEKYSIYLLESIKGKRPRWVKNRRVVLDSGASLSTGSLPRLRKFLTGVEELKEKRYCSSACGTKTRITHKGKINMAIKPIDGAPPITLRNVPITLVSDASWKDVLIGIDTLKKLKVLPTQHLETYHGSTRGVNKYGEKSATYYQTFGRENMQPIKGPRSYP